MSIAIQYFVKGGELMLLVKIKELCSQNSITVSELERVLKFGNGTIHKWDEAQPSIEKVKMVADYFEVSLDYLSGREEKLPTPEARNLALIFDSFSDEQKNLVKCYISIIKKEGCA